MTHSVFIHNVYMVACEDCGAVFEPGAPWDNYCGDCWADRKVVEVEALAAREGE